jgi:hypothetical protein
MPESPRPCARIALSVAAQGVSNMGTAKAAVAAAAARVNAAALMTKPRRRRRTRLRVRQWGCVCGMSGDHRGTLREPEQWLGGDSEADCRDGGDGERSSERAAARRRHNAFDRRGLLEHRRGDHA